MDCQTFPTEIYYIPELSKCAKIDFRQLRRSFAKTYSRDTRLAYNVRNKIG